MACGRRLILSTFLCTTDLGVDWRRDSVGVGDWGDCFFGLTCDIEAGTYDRLSVNGEV